MKRSYILTFGQGLGTATAVREWADKSPLIETWRAEIQYCVFLVSDHSAKEINTDLEKALGRKGAYLISEYAPNCEGLLTPESWAFLQDLEHDSEPTSR
jgi:hypothetical protein